ncbi:hypothetical protein RND81_04G064700 [Saponaria officinalis]|uniref:C2H2-type domain-containing protein n=1 Tax=Saponaria officinalis TaxID=3572 RepID=A0AAW1LJG7_SAPOF
MVAQQETIVGKNVNNLSIIKGKRSKRSRQPSPSALTMSTSATDEGGSVVSQAASVSEEEEDMARCLILLAQGNHNQTKNNCNKNTNKMTSYDCKTCNRSFPSFQALGGHRTSHKKSKVIESSSLIFDDFSNPIQHHNNKIDQFVDDSVFLTLQISNSSPSSNNTNIINSNNNNNNINNNLSVVISKAKIHECSICGAEFSSGQALGGHMRRHRPIGMSNTVTSTTSATVKTEKAAVTVSETANTRNFLSLDLNLPAPEEDNNSKFVFGSNEKTLVFTASSLVDCRHY